MMNRTLSIVLATPFCLGLILTNPARGALILHLDASDPTTVEDSAGVNPGGGGFVPSDVTTWLDKSGSGNHATQATPDDRPTWVGAVQNGLDVLEWTQPQYMSFAVSSSTTGTNPGMTAFVVVKSTSVDMGNLENYDAWLSNTGNAGHFIVDRGDYDGLSFGSGGVEGRAHPDLTVYPNNVNDFHIITAKYDFTSGVATALFNGDPASYDACDPPSMTPPCINAGRTISLDLISRYWVRADDQAGIDAEGQLAEIRFYDENLDFAAEASIGAELGQKWGIPNDYGDFIPPTVHEWSVNSSGDWNQTSNWSSGFLVPNGEDQTAIFGAAIIDDGETVFTNTDVTVNRIEFNNTLPYSISGLGSVNLATDPDDPNDPEDAFGPPALSVTAGSHQFQAIVNLMEDTTVDIASGSTLEFNNGLFLNGNTLTKTGGGTLAVNNDVISAGGSIDLQQGSVIGIGIVVGDVVNNGGSISPGNASGQADSVVPEPATSMMLGVGLLLTAIRGLRKKRKPRRATPLGCNAMNRTLSIVLTTTFCLGLLLTNPAWGAQVLWLDASDPSTIEDSFGFKADQPGFVRFDVTTWFDKSPAENHATRQGDTPTWMGSVQNGLDVLNFEEADSMSIPVVGQGASGLTAFIVVRSTGMDPPDLTNYDAWMSRSNDLGIFITDRGDIGGSGFGTKGEEGRSSGDVNAFHIITAKYRAADGAITTLYNGGNQTDCVDGGADCLNPGKNLTFDQIGRYAGGGPIDGQGDLAEIMFYDEHLTPSAEADIGIALANKWGLPTDYVPVAPATVHEWLVNGSGDWNESNWDTGEVPNGNDQTAIFGAAITDSGQTVFTNTAVTVNQIQFNNTLPYAVSGLGSVNLAATTENPVVPTIDVQSGDHQFQAIVNLMEDTTVNVASGSTLVFNNRLFLNGNTLTKIGEGILAIKSDVVLAGGSIDLQQGTVVGNGTVGGDVINNGGTISPGNPNGQANSVVPEPATSTMLGLGLLMTAICGLRKKR